MGKTEWSILHDLGFAYYILCTLGQKDTKAVKVRFPLIAGKYLEWLSDIEDSEKIYNEVMEAYQIYMSDEKSMDDVMDKLGSCVVNIKNNLSEENRAAFINDLFSIVNAASPTEAEIGQLNHTADFLDVEVNKELKNKKESRKTDDDQEEPWTLLHDMCYLYYIVASVPLLKGSRDANIKLRMNAVSEKILEWPSDDINGEHLVQKVKNYTIQTLREGIKVGDKIIELATKIKEYMPAENHSSIIEDLQYIVNVWSPNKADDEEIIDYVANILDSNDDISDEDSGEASEVDIDDQDMVGRTQLIRAIMEDEIELAKKLVEAGADLSLSDLQGMTALMWAAFKGQTEIVGMLIDEGADIEAYNNDEGETPLLLATAEGHNKIVELLLDKGADIEAKNSQGETAFILAAYNGHIEIVELLIDRGADIEAKDSDGKTALSLAEEEGHKEIVKLLKKYLGSARKNATAKPSAVKQRKVKTEDEIEQGEEIANSDFLSLDTVPVYPGNFYFLNKQYSTKLLRIKNFYRLSRIEKLFRKFSKSEVDCLVKKIKKTNTIPKLNFVREILEEKYTMPEKDAPFWFIPFVVIAEKIGCFFYFGRNGISANFKDAEDIDPCFGWEAAKDVTYEAGFPDLEDQPDESGEDVQISFSVKADPDAEYPDPEKTVSTLVLKTDEGGLTINEFHGEEYGSQLLVVKTIWDLWEKVVDYSRGSSIWPQHDKVPNGPEYIYFDSWDSLLAWACADTEKEKGKIDQNDEQYRKKVKDALADGVVTDLEQAGLDFFQKKLKLSDDDALRIFEEVLTEMQTKQERQIGGARAGDAKKATSKGAILVKTDEGEKGDKALTKGSRTTYETWDEFEKEQSSKDPLKKRFMPIAKNVHGLIVSTYKENNMPYEVKYGDGTFSFAVPGDFAKTRTRTCVRFGLLNFKKDSCYIESLYKDADEELPKGAKLRKKDDPTGYFYNFASPDDFEKVAQDIKKNVVKSYKILAK